MAKEQNMYSENTGKVDPSNISALSDRVWGTVLAPDDDGYDAERAGFQTAAKHRPDVVVGATGAEDVRTAVEFAGENGLPVAVQGTGHALLSVAGEGGVLITTGRMSGVRVDAEKCTAWIEAGVKWEQVIEEAAPHGLAPLSGSAPFVGAVSYTLGGGLGLLSRQYGYAADHVRSIDVVTADAELRLVSAESDPELFWALRGGRDNFGVVTGMEVDLFSVERLYGGALVFDGEIAAEVLRTWKQWTETVPEEMTSSVSLIPFPDIPDVPEPLRGRYVAQVQIAYSSDREAGEQLVEPLRAVGPCLIDTLDDILYAQSGSIHNESSEPEAYDSDNVMLDDLDAKTIQTLLEMAGPEAPVMCIVGIRHLGGAISRPPATANAVGHRDARYNLGILSPLDGYEASAVRALHRRVIEAVAPQSNGRCLNFVFGPITTDQVRTAYDPDDYQRLAELKTVYDPTNMFRLNHNIPPATGRGTR